jgi:CheY-like chemotaxis protein
LFFSASTDTNTQSDAFVGAGNAAKVDLPALPCELLDEALTQATLDSFDVDAILRGLEVPFLQIDGVDTCQSEAALPDAIVPTTPPPVAAAAAADPDARAKATRAKGARAVVRKSPTTIRTLTKAEILVAVESEEVLLADRRQWANLVAQAERVLSAAEVAGLKKRRRRAKGVVDARNARVKKKKVVESTDVQFETAVLQNEALTAKVAQMAADNAALQRELALLRRQLNAANNTPQ